MPAATVTRITIKQDALRVLAKRDEALAALPIPLVTTSAGSTTTLVDTKLGRGTTQANRYDARRVEITAAGSNAGEHAATDDGGFNGTSTLTFSPALTSVGDAATYLLYPLGLSGDLLAQLIDEVLRETTGPHIHFPTAVPDGDLEGTTVADWWGDIGADAPTTKEYATTSTNQWIAEQIFGARSLHIVESGADGGVKSDIFYVGDTESFVASFFVHVVSGTLTVSVYDETNSATIGTAVSIDEPGWKEVRFTEAVPAACESVSVRFKAAANTEEYYVSAPIIFQTTSGTHHYEMPSWFLADSQFRQALFLPLGVSSEDTGSYVALSAALKPVIGNEPQFLNEARGINPFKTVLQATADGPVALLVERAFDALSDNTSTTNADREYMRSKVIATVLRDWGDAAFPGWARRARARAEAMGYNLREVRIEPNPVTVA